MKFALIVFFSVALFHGSFARSLELPTRSLLAMNGAAFAESIQSLPLRDREEKIFSEVMAGNLPEFLRRLCPVNTTNISSGKTNIATFFTTPDYIAVGSNDDYFLTPLTPFTAQKMADALNCILPTRQMVNAIFSNAVVKLPPTPIPPNTAMITVPVFKQHNDTVRQQRAVTLKTFPLGALTAGHKKDLVISSRLKKSPGKVAIYGWHRTNGIPIQPLYLGHAASWADYSHGIRFVQRKLSVNGESKTAEEVLENPELTALLSDEGIVESAKYLFTEFPIGPGALTSVNAANPNLVVMGPLQNSPQFREQTMLLQLDHGVRVVINTPSLETFASTKKTKLVLYGLPNGNTIEQTIGKQTTTNDDWHFDIQHIGAQTRFLRERLTNENLVVAYLENSLKAWPAWRKQFGDRAVLSIFETIVKRFQAYEPNIILTGHSGGGSFIFGYLNSVKKIPDQIERIAFLDSNYAYETQLHRDKLVNWLMNSNQHFLTILAYHDAIALLNGKTFVSVAGGTWGKSHLMKKDFDVHFNFSDQFSPEFKKYSALDSRLQFLLKENPEKKILHTVQVERNGFIHAMLTGTALENQGYDYFGPRVYDRWIHRE